MTDGTLVVMTVDSLKEIAQFFFWVIAGIGVAVFLGAYFWTRVKGGTDKADQEKDKILQETKDLYKEQNAELKGQLEKISDELRTTQKDVAYLKGQNNFAKEVITAALTNHFNTHPEVVSQVQDRIK